MSVMIQRFGPTDASHRQDTFSKDEISRMDGIFTEAISYYNDRTQLSWVLIMPAMQTMAVRLLIETRGVNGARSYIQELIIDPFQKAFGPDQQEPFSDTATLEVPNKQFPQLHQFNVYLADVVKAMVAKNYSTELIAYTLSVLVIKIAAKAIHPAFGVKILMQSCYDLQQGLYNFLV
jgi:hypothetical protein